MSGGGFRCTYDGNSQDIAQAAFQMPYADTPGMLVEIIVRKLDDEQSNPIGRTKTKRRNKQVDPGV